MWVSITYSFSFCYCFIFLPSSEPFSSDFFFYMKNVGFYSLKNYSIRNQKMPSVYIRKKYRNVFWMESKFLQHSWRQLVCLQGALHPSTVLSVCIHLPQTTSSFEYLNFFSNPFKWTAWKSEHILAIWTVFLHTGKSKYQMILAQNPVVQREIAAPLLEKHGL